MMKRIYLVCAVLLLLSAAASATEIIVINDTEEKIYTLDMVEISGNLEKNVLKISGSGEVIQGDGVKVYLIGPASDVVVRDLAVNGKPETVSFDENGYFFLADKGKLRLSGELEIRTIGQVNLYIHGPINELRFDLEKGYAINGDRFGAYKERVILQRAEKVSMLVDGNFRYTYAERNEFLYIINFRAFGSSLGGYTLELPNQETVTSVQGAAKWEQSGNRLVLDLESSQATVTIAGLFNSLDLRIPLKEERHHALIESDPEKRISIDTSAEEIDLSESSMRPQFSNARAFIASYNNRFRISVKELDVLPSLAASVRSATNRIAITSKGSVLSDTMYSYANTGVDYIEMDVEGDPLYASTGGGAVKLTKDEKLLLSFPKTEYGNLDLVTFTTRSPLGLVSMVNVPIAKTDLPITTATTEIYLPKEYVVLETFGAKGGSELPPAESAILFLIVTGILAVSLKISKRFTIAYILLAIGLYYFNLGLFLILVAITLIGIARKHLPKEFSLKWILAGAGLLVAIVILLVVPFVIWQSGVFGGGTHATRSVGASYAMVDEAEMAVPMGLEKIGDGGGAITVPQRQGVLPVKLELPRLGKRISVTNDLVTKENPVELQILVISEYLKYLLYLVSLLAGLLAYKEYKNR